MPQSRNKQLQRMSAILNSPDGELLMDELEIEWDKYNLVGETELDTGRNIGLREAFKFLRYLQDGEFDDE